MIRILALVAALVKACGLPPIRGKVPASVAMTLAHLCDAGVVLSRGRWHAPISAYLIAELTTDHYSDITRARERLGASAAVKRECAFRSCPLR